MFAGERSCPEADSIGGNGRRPGRLALRPISRRQRPL